MRLSRRSFFGGLAALPFVGSVFAPLAKQSAPIIGPTTYDLTMSLDEFSRRVMQPAMAALVSNIEGDVGTMYAEADEWLDGDSDLLLADMDEDYEDSWEGD